jgi:hypothetical protein
MYARAHPGEHDVQARRFEGSVERVKGGARCRRREGRMWREGGDCESADPPPCTDSSGHAPVRASERWDSEPEARVKQLGAELTESNTLLSGDPRQLGLKSHDPCRAFIFLPLHQIVKQIRQTGPRSENGRHATLAQPAYGYVQGFDAIHRFARSRHEPGLSGALVVTVTSHGGPVLRHVQKR